MRQLIIYIISIIIFQGFISCRKSDYELVKSSVISDNGSGIGTVRWTAGKTYILEGFVFVNDGQTLTIEPGTIVRFKTGQAEDASALIVARGGKIMAKGTHEKPIIFTVEGDDLTGSVSVKSKGLWGGIIILGNAPVNAKGGEAKIEGIPISEPRSIFGGTIPDDNSGVLEYISIRHSGANIGEGNEINGLTLGGVGSGTTINHIEVISNADDGFEFFGGNVDCKYLAAFYCDDDAFDFDLGYCGKLQYITSIQDNESGDALIEITGKTNTSAITETSPVIYNATCIGHRNDITSKTITFDKTAAGGIYNSIFLNQQKGIYIEYIAGTKSSYSLWLDKKLNIAGNLFYDIEDNIESSIIRIFGDQLNVDQTADIVTRFAENNNFIGNPGIEYTTKGTALFQQNERNEKLAALNDDWFDNVTFRGAFGSINWLDGWSLYSQSGE